MKHVMKAGRIHAGAALLVLSLNATSAEPGSAAGAAVTVADSVERGRYIVMTSACHDCHTPWIAGPNGPEPDMSRMLSGHPQSETIAEPASLAAPWIMAMAPTNTAWSGPWGVSFTANLTPDDETGLGKWTPAMFRDTIRNGRHKGRGRPVLPPMPIPVYRNFTDADLDAIFAYLQSVPAIRNQVPEPLPPAEPVAGGN